MTYPLTRNRPLFNNGVFMKIFMNIVMVLLFSTTGFAADYQDGLLGKSEFGKRCSFLIEQNIKYDVKFDEQGKLLSKNAVGRYVVYLTYSDDLNDVYNPEAYDPQVKSQVTWSYNYLEKIELDMSVEENGVKLSKSDEEGLLFSVLIVGVKDLNNLRKEAIEVIVDVPFRKDLEKTNYKCSLDE